MLLNRYRLVYLDIVIFVIRDPIPALAVSFNRDKEVIQSINQSINNQSINQSMYK